MADRVARVVWEEPRRRIGFGAGLAAAIVAAVLLTGVLSTGSTSARSLRATGQSAKMSAINGKVNALIAKMTVRGEVRPAHDGRARRRQRDARTEAAGRGEERHDRHGARPGRRRQHQPGPAGRAAIAPEDPADLRPRRDPRLQDDVPRADRRGLHAGIPPPSSATSPCRRPRRPPTGSSGRSTRWSTSAVTRAGDGWSREPARIRSWARRSPRRRCAATRATTSARPTRWPRRSSTSRATAPPSRAANTTPSTCRCSSSTTTTRRRTRPRSTPGRRR